MHDEAARPDQQAPSQQTRPVGAVGRRRRPAAEDEPRRRTRPPLATVALLVIGAVFGAAGTLTWQVRPTAEVATGQLAAIDDTGSAILVDGPEELADVGLGVVGVRWREVDADGQPLGQWRRTVSDEGNPTCLAPGDEGRPLRLGLLTDPGSADRPPGQVVAWVECGPVGSDPAGG